MSLRVVVNATPLLSPLTGIGNYIVELGRALAASGEVDLYSFYGFRWRHEPPTAAGEAAAGKAVRRVRDIIKPFVPAKRQLRAAQQQVMFARGLARNRIALYHEPNYVALRFDVPVVVTVHDLSFLHYPGTHPADRVRWLERGLPRTLDRAGAILVDSEFVRGEVIATFGVAADRVHTAHLGAGPQFHPRTADDTAPVLHSHALAHGAYVLCVGTIEPRKNLGHALAAYARLAPGLRERFPFVVAGAKGWRAGDLERELARLTDLGQVRFLGHVPTSHLPSLYAGAAAFVFPSLYEGFGLPPLEAMASGVPVLASDRGSLPEITGCAAALIAPDDPESTATTLAAVLQDENRRRTMIEDGLREAQRFSWARCARETLGAYRQAV